MLEEKYPSLHKQQPWQAAYEQDFAWFSDTLVKHYHGDDSQAMVLLGGLTKAFGALIVEAFEYTADAENALKMAQDRGWVVVSVKQDWRNVFAFQTPGY